MPNNIFSRMNSGVYRVRNVVDGKSYVGSSSDLKRRWRTHRDKLRRGAHHSNYLQNAWNKYGESTFVFEMLIWCAPDDLVFYEQRALDRLCPEYNMSPTAGSCRGFKHSEETKRKMSAKKQSVSAETRKKLSLAATGKQQTVEHQRHIQEGRAGFKHTDESKNKISESKKGIRHSLESRRKQSKAMKLRWASKRESTDAESTP